MYILLLGRDTYARSRSFVMITWSGFQSHNITLSKKSTSDKYMHEADEKVHKEWMNSRPILNVFIEYLKFKIGHEDEIRTAVEEWNFVEYKKWSEC